MTRRACGVRSTWGLEMGVMKYRSVAEMPDPPMAASPLAGVSVACRMSELSAAFGPVAVPPRGVRKFRSIAEASAHREAWEDEAMRQRAAYLLEQGKR